MKQYNQLPLTLVKLEYEAKIEHADEVEISNETRSFLIEREYLPTNAISIATAAEHALRQLEHRRVARVRVTDIDSFPTSLIREIE